MKKKIVVFDFAVFCDVQEGARAFWEDCREDIAALSGHSLQDVEQIKKERVAEMQRDPSGYPWMCYGSAVGLAVVNPYRRLTAAARYILQRRAHGSRLTEAFLESLTEILYRQHTPVPKIDDDTYNVLEAATEQCDALYIVSDEREEWVRDELEDILDENLEWLLQCVRGTVARDIVSPTLGVVRPTLAVSQLHRRVELRRPEYFGVLDELRRLHKARWAEMTVVGRDFEYDLALPTTLGAHIILLADEFTPAYERTFLAKRQRAHVVETLWDVLEHL